MKIRQMSSEDIEAVIQVERVAWGNAAASPDAIVSRAKTFPEGSLVTEMDGRVVGYAAAQLTDHISTGTWAEQTDCGLIRRSHRPNGRLAYGVSMSALPGLSGESVARSVIGHYAQVFLLSGRCSALCLGSRLPGFARWAGTRAGDADLQDYLRPGTDGRVRDPELRLYASNGFQVLWGLPGYFPDPESHDHGAMIVRTAA